MPVRYIIQRTSSTGENITVDFAQWNPVTGEIAHDNATDMNSLLDEHLANVDKRIVDLQQRSFDAMGLREHIIQHFGVELWSKIIDFLDIMHGRQTPDMVLRRWHSAIEETANLEAGRLQHNGDGLHAAHD